jgi:hypothetical protein
LEACFIRATEEETMNTSLTTVIAAERQQRMVQDAAEYRRARSRRRGKSRRHTRRSRVSAFVKDLAAASL